MTLFLIFYQQMLIASLLVFVSKRDQIHVLSLLPLFLNHPTNLISLKVTQNYYPNASWTYTFSLLGRLTRASACYFLYKMYLLRRACYMIDLLHCEDLNTPHRICKLVFFASLLCSANTPLATKKEKGRCIFYCFAH